MTSRSDSDFQPYIDAVRQGYLAESTLDTTVERLFTARIKLGLFDPPEMVPYNKIDVKELDSAEHRAYARKLANEAMVLLKNDGMLPLKPGIKKIVVVGPLADQTRPLIGNYAGQPTHIVSVMDGLKAEFPNATITYVPGTQFLRNDGDPVPNSVLTNSDGKPGLKAEYTEYRGFRPGGFGGPGIPPPRLHPQLHPPPTSRATNSTSISPRPIFLEATGKPSVGVHWTGFLTAPDSGDYQVGLKSRGFRTSDARRQSPRRPRIRRRWQRDQNSNVSRVHLDKGQKVALDV